MWRSAEPVILSCWGTVALVQESKQVNPKDERFSFVFTVDVAKKTLTVDGGWPLNDDTSRTTIVAMSLGKGRATLNRITGAATVHTIRDDGQQFNGECKPAQKMF